MEGNSPKHDSTRCKNKSSKAWEGAGRCGSQGGVGKRGKPRGGLGAARDNTRIHGTLPGKARVGAGRCGRARSPRKGSRRRGGRLTCVDLEGHNKARDGAGNARKHKKTLGETMWGAMQQRVGWYRAKCWAAWGFARRGLPRRKAARGGAKDTGQWQAKGGANLRQAARRAAGRRKERAGRRDAGRSNARSHKVAQGARGRGGEAGGGAGCRRTARGDAKWDGARQGEKAQKGAGRTAR